MATGRLDRRRSVTRIRTRGGMTVLELLVSVAITGVVAALILPAVIHARESTRTTVCRNHLRQLGMALHNYHDRRRQLPASWNVDRKDSEFAFGWASELLPDLEQTAPADLLRPSDRGFQLSSRESASRLVLPLLLCPSDISEPSFQLFSEIDDEDDDEDVASIAHPAQLQPEVLCHLPTSNYLGVYGTVEADDFDEFPKVNGTTYGDGSLIDGKRVTFADLRRGLSNTIVVGERTMAKLPSTWVGFDLRSEDHGCRVAGSAMSHPNCDTCDECEFDSRHVAGSNFLWADGRVTVISEFIDQLAYQKSAQRSSATRDH